MTLVWYSRLRFFFVVVFLVSAITPKITLAWEGKPGKSFAVGPFLDLGYLVNGNTVTREPENANRRNSVAVLPRGPLGSVCRVEAYYDQKLGIAYTKFYAIGRHASSAAAGYVGDGQFTGRLWQSAGNLRSALDHIRRGCDWHEAYVISVQTLPSFSTGLNSVQTRFSEAVAITAKLSFENKRGGIGDGGWYCLSVQMQGERSRGPERFFELTHGRC